MIKKLARPLRHLNAEDIYKIFSDESYRRYFLLKFKLSGWPSLTQCHVNLSGLNLSIPDADSFLSFYKEIFVNKVYAFHANSSTPNILDLGANIGMSVLFFKLCYPQARITAFEAEPTLYGHLKRNIHGNGYSDVELINKAAWHENTTLKFHPDWFGSGCITFKDDMQDIIEVEAVNIAELLKTNRFDLIKMDIEGAEEFILPACKDYLQDVRFIIMEYHPSIGQKDRLNVVINALVDANFRLHIHCADEGCKDPFFWSNGYADCNKPLYIFGWHGC